MWARSGEFARRREGAKRRGRGRGEKKIGKGEKKTGRGGNRAVGAARPHEGNRPSGRKTARPGNGVHHPDLII
jgi:hypothetical protein